MQIPVYLKSGERLPRLRDNESRYVVADNGTFLERRTSMFSACTRISHFDLRLDHQDQYCVLHCGRLPRAMHRAMLAFFTAAHELHGGEAALVLLFHPERRLFRWHCPPQTVEMFQTFDGRWTACDRIEFDNPLELPDGFLHFGDAHLHPGPPNPSSIDVADDQDGLHIIAGNLHKERPDYNIDFVIDGIRFRVRPEHVFEDPDCTAFERPPRQWMDQIRICKQAPLKNKNSSYDNNYNGTFNNNRSSNSNYNSNYNNNYSDNYNTNRQHSDDDGPRGGTGHGSSPNGNFWNGGTDA
jgi:hypothetical protein